MRNTGIKRLAIYAFVFASLIWLVTIAAMLHVAATDAATEAERGAAEISGEFRLPPLGLEQPEDVARSAYYNHLAEYGFRAALGWIVISALSATALIVAFVVLSYSGWAVYRVGLKIHRWLDSD